MTVAAPTTGHEPDEILLAFSRALRAAGVPVTADRTRAYLEAVAVVGLGDRDRTRAAGRATPCGSPDDLARHDRVFDAWFGGATPRPAAATPRRRSKTGDEPVQRGVVAVLPHVDDFLAGHSLATYTDLMEVVARA